MATVSTRWYPLGTTDVTADPPAEMMEAVLRLQRFGHAITLSTTSDANGKLVSAEVHHYRTCRACEEIRKEIGEEKDADKTT